MAKDEKRSPVDWSFINKVIVSPSFTEKASKSEKEAKYMFFIEKRATKGMVKKAIEMLYNLKALKINIVKNPKKIKTNIRGRRVEVKPQVKKAIVTLQKGQKLDPLKFK